MDKPLVQNNKGCALVRTKTSNNNITTSYVCIPCSPTTILGVEIVQNLNILKPYINGTKEPTHEYQNCNISQMLKYGGYFKMSETFVDPSYCLGGYHSKPY